MSLMASPRLKSVRCVVLRHTTRVTLFYPLTLEQPDRQIRVFKLLPHLLPSCHRMLDKGWKSFDLDLLGWAGFYCAVRRVGGHTGVSKAEAMQCNAMQRKQHATPILSRTGIGPGWPRHPEAPTQLARSRHGMGSQGKGKEEKKPG